MYEKYLPDDSKPYKSCVSCNQLECISFVIEGIKLIQYTFSHTAFCINLTPYFAKESYLTESEN